MAASAREGMATSWASGFLVGGVTGEGAGRACLRFCVRFMLGGFWGCWRWWRSLSSVAASVPSSVWISDGPVSSVLQAGGAPVMSVACSLRWMGPFAAASVAVLGGGRSHEWVAGGAVPRGRRERRGPRRSPTATAASTWAGLSPRWEVLRDNLAHVEANGSVDVRVWTPAPHQSCGCSCAPPCSRSGEVGLDGVRRRGVPLGRWAGAWSRQRARREERPRDRAQGADATLR